MCLYYHNYIKFCSNNIIRNNIHLLKVAKVKNENCKANFRVLFMINITLIGIISFFVSIVFIILLMLQLILTDGHKLKRDTNSLHEFYYSSFEEIEYMIVIFDAFGHLAMITVFVVRLRMCFANSIFGYSKKLIRFMYCCLIVLCAMSFVIIMEIINGQDPKTIIITEIIWELLIEFMCIWLLYLFVSKLQTLIKMALGTSRKNLRLTISCNISEKIRDRHDTEGSRNNSLRRLSRFSRTSLDVDRRRDKSTKERSPSAQPTAPNSPAPPPPPPSPSASAKSGKGKKKKPNQTVLNDQNLVNVMTKMTLLVVIAVFGSILSIIGNIYIEIDEIENIEKHTASLDAMWVFLLPVIDMILASFMLYLQFDFTKHVYKKLCTKMDIIFLQFCGDILDQEMTHEQMKVHREQSEQNSLKINNEASREQSKSVKSKSHPNNNKLQINFDKENSLRRTTSIYSNGAEIPGHGLERAITPRPKDFKYGVNKLTVDISDNDGHEHSHLFRPPSPSPSPLAELSPRVKAAINRHNSAVEIPIKPPRLSTVSFKSNNSFKSNKDVEIEEEHDEEEKQAVLSRHETKGRPSKTSISLNRKGSNASNVSRGSRKSGGSVKDLAARFEMAQTSSPPMTGTTRNSPKKGKRVNLAKLRINVLSRSGDDFERDIDDGQITPMSPSKHLIIPILSKPYKQ